jgi:hypothetical protein
MSLDQKESRVGLFGRIPLTDKLIIATLPVLAYTFVYLYKRGYYDIFRLPAEFITFTVSDAFIVLTALVGLLLSIWFPINALFSLVPRRAPRALEWRLQLFIPCALLILVSFNLYGFRWTEWWFPLLVGLVLGIRWFLHPLVVKRHTGSYLERMAALDQERAQSPNEWEDTQSLVYWATSSLRPQQVALIAYAIIGLYTVYHFGRSSALNQQMFLVASTSPETVVLVMNPDWAICAPFDRQNKQLEPGIRVLEMPGKGDVEFRQELVGPLSLPALTTSPTPTQMPSQAPGATPAFVSTPAPTIALSPLLTPTPP